MIKKCHWAYLWYCTHWVYRPSDFSPDPSQLTGSYWTSLPTIYTHVCHSFLNKGSNMECKTAKEKRDIIFKSKFIASDELRKMWKICKDRQVQNIKGSEKLRWAWAYRQNVDDLIGKIVLRGRTTFQLTLIEAFKWLTVSKALLSST